MSWSKILIGLAVIVAVVVFYYRWLRQMRGGGGVSSGLDVSVPKRKRGSGPNDLEAFIAARRAAQLTGAPVGGSTVVSESQSVRQEHADTGNHANDIVASKSLPIVAAAEVTSEPSPMNLKPKTSISGNTGPTTLLGPEHKLLYLICRTAMPAHHVFAKINVADVLPVLGKHADVNTSTFDIVVCRSDLTVQAIVDFADRRSDTAQEKVMGAMTSAKVRYIVVNPREMPRPQELRDKLAGS